MQEEATARPLKQWANANILPVTETGVALYVSVNLMIPIHVLALLPTNALKWDAPEALLTVNKLPTT